MSTYAVCWPMDSRRFRFKGYVPQGEPFSITSLFFEENGAIYAARRRG